MNEHLHFAPFHLDLENERLWRGAQTVLVRPKSYALLRYLVEHPNRLILHAELMQALWHHQHLSDGLLRSYIKELRHALGDEASAPRFIETANGRGYRFLAAVTRAPADAMALAVANPPSPRQAAGMSYFVGREGELGWLHDRLGRALEGQRQLVWISGEPGIGKTAIAELFVSLAASRQPIWVARGQCVEQHGLGEPYMPVLEALGRLARDGGEPVLAALRRHGPSWLVQLPSLVDVDERSRLMAATFGLTQERMARELTDTLEALCAQRPLLLLLEDLHWSDPSTVQLLALLARRIEPARLLIVGTYRPAEAGTQGQPLRSAMQELHTHNLCADLPLRTLTQEEVAAYVALRFALDPSCAAVSAWARLLHGRTEGVPLFLVAVVDELGDQLPPQPDAAPSLHPPDALGATGIPTSLFHLFDRQIERLGLQEQQVLGAASVSGMEFSPALIAAVEGVEQSHVEACCERLAAIHLFLDATPQWRGPERRAADRYRFRHALQRDALHRRMPAAGLRRLHRRIGECKEATYGGRGVVVAAELAAHFERGGDIARALRYLAEAARQALQRAANPETIGHLERALELLASLPTSVERDRQELGLQAMLAMPLLMTQGHSAPAVRQAFARAFELTERAGSAPELLSSLFGLYRHALVGGDLARAQRLAEQMLQAADQEPGRPRRATACLAAASVQYHRGAFESALVLVEECLGAHDGVPSGQHFLEHGEDEVSIALSHAAWLQTVLGYPQKARARAAQLREHAEGLDHPFARMEAHVLLAYLGLVTRDPQATVAEAEAALALGREHGLAPLLMASVTLHRGWGLALQGQAEAALPPMRQALAGVEAAGARLWYAFLRLQLGEACLCAGRVDEALRLVEEATAVASELGQGSWLSECRRLGGEVLLQQAHGAGSVESAQAEAAFLEAIALSREQRAKLLELRATTSLVRLLRQEGRAEKAKRALAELYSSFSEGFDHHDLVQAKRLLDQVEPEAA